MPETGLCSTREPLPAPGIDESRLVQPPKSRVGTTAPAFASGQFAFLRSRATLRAGFILFRFPVFRQIVAARDGFPAGVQFAAAMAPLPDGVGDHQAEYDRPANDRHHPHDLADSGLHDLPFLLAHTPLRTGSGAVGAP